MSFISASKVFGHLDRVVAWQRGETPAPVTVEWDLSNACTLGCRDCHFAYTHTKGPWAGMPRQLPVDRDASQTTFADATLVWRVLGELKDAGARGIVWSGGGEPTTHPSWIRIVDHAHQLGLEQGMYTHGGLLTAESAAHLASVATWVVVSLDHTDGDGYAREKRVPAHRFDAACDGVRRLSGRSAVIGVSYLLHAENWTRAREMVRFTRELGAHYTTLRPAIHTAPDHPGTILSDRAWVTNALPLLDGLSKEPDVEVSPERFVAYRDWRGHGYSVCRGITLNTTITPDGRVWVCPNRREFPNSCLGDLRQESFAAIWSRHPGQWTDFAQCRAMCRLHQVNQQLTEIHQARAHEAFV